MVSRFLLAGTFVFGLATPLMAQLTPHGMRGMQGMQQGMQPTQVEVKGVLAGVARGNLVVMDEKNFRWQIAVAPQTSVHVTGVVTTDYLHAGMLVEFETEIDNRGIAKTKVSELTITTAGKDKAVGLSPLGDDEQKKEPPAKAAPDPKRGRRTPASGKAIQAGKYRIVGNLAGARNGKYSARAGRANVQFELADDAKIIVDVNQLSINIVRRGDKITVKGMAYPNHPGAAMARDINVQVGEPLEKKKAGKTDERKLDDGKPAGGGPEGGMQPPPKREDRPGER